MEKKHLAKIEKIIGYSFNDKHLLIRAFTHSSFANENQRHEDYERLEFVGDAALGYVVAAYLYNTYPSKTEGELTKMRACMVSADTLASVVESLDIIKYLKVGAGTQAEESLNIKSDLFEAIVGAMIVDNNYEFVPAREFILKHLANIADTKIIDYKSKILEYCAKNCLKAKFNIISKTIIDNKTHFNVNLTIDGKEVATANGGNKKTAEKLASQIFYKQINQK